MADSKTFQQNGKEDTKNVLHNSVGHGGCLDTGGNHCGVDWMPVEFDAAVDDAAEYMRFWGELDTGYFVMLC